MTFDSNYIASEINHLRVLVGDISQPPDDCPEGWSISKNSPLSILAVFTPLRIKKGYTLRAYQYLSSGNGNGFVWAMPIDADFPNTEECPRLQDEFLEPPKPPQSLDNCMDVIEGDGSPWSHLCASLLERELREFGAVWHGCDWSEHRILDADPWKDSLSPKEDTVSPIDEWQWRQPRPADWKPRVIQHPDRTIVTFLSYSWVGRESIYKHVDVYLPRSYKPDSSVDIVAIGERGGVF